MAHLTITSAALLIVAGAALVQGGSYDYGDALKKSLLFYQAQRSGKLHGMDPLVSWRKDSALKDKGNNGEDLTGGYYDAGDFVKFGFPMAYTITVLSWGVIDFEKGYQSVNALTEARNAIKWGTDYIIKAHVSANEFYGQVANSKLDHDYWGRPEDMTMKRPAYKIDTKNPGSDLAAEAASALAAASIVFKKVDSKYSSTLLTHAKQLYDFADNYRGKYSKSIADAQGNYESSEYTDELAWGAAWLYRATNEKSYLDKAEKYYKKWELQYNNSPLSWDDKSSGATALLAKITGDKSYKNYLKDFCENVFYKQKRTPKGLIFFTEWASIPTSINAAFVCLHAAELGIQSSEYRKEAKQQVDYALGDAGHSFVVGFGKNPPTHEQHAAASCPDAPAKCDWDTFEGKQPNAHILYGALVGGPDAKDKYEDRRDDYVHNEVACDYNAAYQGALAALKANGY